MATSRICATLFSNCVFDVIQLHENTEGLRAIHEVIPSVHLECLDTSSAMQVVLQCISVSHEPHSVRPAPSIKVLSIPFPRSL